LNLLPLAVFVATYAAIAVGRIPGLALDRTGFALLGALAFLGLGTVSLEAAKDSVDAPTLALLFGMMVLSALYQQSGLYTRIGAALARSTSPRRLLAGTLVSAAALSAVLTNDVVCFAMAPLVAASVVRAGLPPLPYLLALACATNIGSALTPIGNPQNILISQRLALPFAPFVLACAAPVLLSLGFLYLFLARRVPRVAPRVGELPPATQDETPFQRGPAVKAIVLTAAALVLFLTKVPAHLTALGVAALVLTSRRMYTRSTLALVDWHLLALFCGLFVVNRGLEASGWTARAVEALAGAGVDFTSGAVLVPAVAGLGLLVGNVPATMLLLPLVPHHLHVGYAIALASTFAGNAVLFGSIANLIVAERAAPYGVRLGFRDHLAVGVPVTLVSLVLAALAMVLW
jgi:Na+/H+ antiporter NhaD/arsenite permease-like protein